MCSGPAASSDVSQRRSGPTRSAAPATNQRSRSGSSAVSSRRFVKGPRSPKQSADAAMPMETITERSDEELISRTDRLIAELSSSLIRIENDNIATAVDDALRRSGESLDVDRCLLLECIENNATVDAVFHWSRPAVGSIEGDVDVAPFKTLLD